MREIEFRGKDLVTDQWAFCDLFKIKNNFHIVDETDIGEDGHLFRQISDNPTWVIPETVGQYTGLKDINGVKIFEGDIVDFGEGKAEIVFEKGKFCFVYGDNFFTTRKDFQECVVIGNIHDNPELLKKQEQ